MMIRTLCLSVLLMLLCTDIEALKNKGLKCYTCNEKYCSKPQHCSRGQMCMSASVVGIKDGQQEKSYYRSCTSPSYCAKLGKTGTLSINVDSPAFVAAIQCCNSSLCNQKPPPYPEITIWEWPEVPEPTTPEPTLPPCGRKG